MYKLKHKDQLGVSSGAARNKLVKKLLFDMAVKLNIHLCFRCGEPITEEELSIDHKIPWLDSKNPLDLYFDLSNIAFSHNICNTKAARRPNKIIRTEEQQREIWSAQKRRNYSKEKRRLKYKSKGY